MWEALAEICATEGITPSDLVTMIAARQRGGTLTAAVRVAILEYFRSRKYPDS